MDYPLENTIDDAQKIRIRRIKAGSLFRLVATGVFTVIVPLCVFFGILALFGFDTVHVNRRQVHGVEGLIDALIMALILAFVGQVSQICTSDSR